MNEKLFEFLKQDIDGLRSEVREDLKEIKSSLDEVLRFKWQIIGGSVIISAFLSVAVSFMSAILSR